ncbi:hypothetical protein C5167_037772 [Papaver somniferum]|uniref:Homeobox domain-containing protein n=1 Tax=Papaver somniferum TaxID=3469 RepID=A0A4Y7IBQ2_PAPSO|nr:protein WUSCHEL-like [Papaver somniferum]RZC44829.1 hypothetical protein C5167_037772 [Papaver somniferum]
MEHLHHLQDPQHQMQNFHQLQLQQQQPQQQVQYINIEDSGSGSSSSSNCKNSSSLLCRQNNTCSTTTTARWTPTSDQIRILKDLYYNNGVRSPTAEQIQRISAKLRQYGKIEGKNVFYWFQNHKARERQKKRFTLDMAAMQQQRSSTSSGLSNGAGTGTTGVGLNYGGGTRGGGGWRHTDLHHLHDYYYAIENNHPTSNIHNPGIPSPTSPPSSHGMLTSVGPIGTSTASYGSVLMERRFRECSISAGGSSSIGNSTSNNIGGWVGVHQNHNTNNYHHQEIPTPQYPSYTTTSSTLSTYSPAFVEKPSRILPIQLFKEEPDNNNEEEEEVAPEIETLPLFPMQTGDEDLEIPVVENQTIIPNYFIRSSNSETSNGFMNHNPLTGYYIRSSSSVVVPLHDHHHHHQQELMNGGINLNRTASSSLELTLNSYTPITPEAVHGHHHQLN